MRFLVQILLFLVCLAASVSGLYFAYIFDDAAHGGRGGAVGVAISFAYLFVSSLNTYKSLNMFDEAAKEISKAFKSDLTIEKRVQTNFERFNLLTQDLESEAERQIVTNRFLAASAVVSTLFWGFGDLMAECWVLS